MVIGDFKGEDVRSGSFFHNETLLTALGMRSIWHIHFGNRLDPRQDTRHSRQEISRVVPGYGS